ncbi:reverse transcriptase domain-containing protein [Tanacetum coccineum]
MVKKHDGSWRMCVDFTDLNKACPQDCYHLPKIDWKVESLCGYPFKCFLNAYKGYHQIQMAESDEDKTAFHTSQGAFDSQVGRNIEVYVDDLVIKSQTEAEMLRHIDETFRTLRKINMKLNPKKCTFGAVEGMFLGYMISPEGIKPCPDKTEAVLRLPSPRTIKEVQSLNMKLSSLIRFLFKSGTMLQATKAALVRATPAGNTQAKGGTDCIPVRHPRSYYSITGFCGQEVAKVFPSASHCGYYRPTDQTNNFTSRRGRTITKWSVMLGEHNITYRPRTSMKGQILTNFLIEKPDESPSDTVVETLQEPWTLFTDGSSCVDGSGAGLILTSPEGTEFTYALRFQFTASNNEAEYEALIAGLWIAA